MRHIALLLAGVSLLFTIRLFAADPTQDAIERAQEWAFALVASAKTQIEAGATDPKAIRKKAAEDTQPQEKKLRAAMKELGDTPQNIDKGIKKDRALYLEDVEADIKKFQQERKNKIR